MAEERTGLLEGHGGIRLFRRSWCGVERRGLVLLLHGLGEHSGRYGHAGDVLAARGFELHAIDLRGHGLSAGRRGHVPRLRAYLEDLDALRRRAEAEAPGVPCFLLGHSLGGLIVGRYAQATAPGSVRGVALVAPFVGVSMPIPAWKRALGAVADRALPALVMDNGLSASDLFRREAERRAWEDDPLVHRRISARLWGEMQRGAAALLRDAPGLEPETLFQLAGDERIVSNAAARELAARLERKAEVREYEDARHALYRDPNGAAALDDLATWLEARAGSGS